MIAEDGVAGIRQRWSWAMILLSYLISTSGSYCTIQLIENWRHVKSVTQKRVMLALSSVALGGCGIWCTHFTGMAALDLEFEDGSSLEMDFELGLTILSLLFAVVGVLVGLAIASSDPYFLEAEAARGSDLPAASIENVVGPNGNDATTRTKMSVLFARLWRIALGGAFAALGVLGMHYSGMMAQRTSATMSFSARIVVLSVFIAFITTNVAFWILFRVLTFRPDSELLRVGSAMVMGVAVCATHYCGMGAASYKHSIQDYEDATRFVVDRTEAAVLASHGSLLLCYWLASLSVARRSPFMVVPTASPTQKWASNQVSTIRSKLGSQQTQRIHVAS